MSFFLFVQEDDRDSLKVTYKYTYTEQVIRGAIQTDVVICYHRFLASVILICSPRFAGIPVHGWPQPSPPWTGIPATLGEAPDG